MTRNASDKHFREILEGQEQKSDELRDRIHAEEKFREEQKEEPVREGQKTK